MICYWGSQGHALAISTWTTWTESHPKSPLGLTFEGPCQRQWLENPYIWFHRALLKQNIHVTMSLSGFMSFFVKELLIQFHKSKLFCLKSYFFTTDSKKSLNYLNGYHLVIISIYTPFYGAFQNFLKLTSSKDSLFLAFIFSLVSLFSFFPLLSK